MSLAEVTGDGLADLITPNPDHVAVLVAGEDGGFRPQTTLPAPFGPFSVVAADLTGDGCGGRIRRRRGLAGDLTRLAAWSFRDAGRYKIASGPTKERRSGSDG